MEQKNWEISEFT